MYENTYNKSRKYSSKKEELLYNYFSFLNREKEV